MNAKAGLPSCSRAPLRLSPQKRSIPWLYFWQPAPKIIGEAWKNEFHVFHWLYHLINHLNFMFYITTYKDNGQNNVCLHAWGFVDSDPNQGTYFIFALNKKGHTYRNVQREGVFCINYQTQDTPGLGKTVQYNAYEDDEIGAPGLAAEKCVRINAPRIGECGLYLECTVLWEKDIPPSNHVVIASRVEYVTLDEAVAKYRLSRETEGI